MSAMDFFTESSYLVATTQALRRSWELLTNACNILQFGDATFSDFVLQLSVILFYNKQYRNRWEYFSKKAGKKSIEEKYKKQME